MPRRGSSPSTRTVPRVRAAVALAGLERGGLAGAVGSEHGGDRVPLDLERQPVDGDLVAVPHHQAVDDDGGVGGWHAGSLGSGSATMSTVVPGGGRGGRAARTRRRGPLEAAPVGGLGRILDEAPVTRRISAGSRPTSAVAVEHGVLRRELLGSRPRVPEVGVLAAIRIVRRSPPPPIRSGSGSWSGAGRHGRRPAGSSGRSAWCAGRAAAMPRAGRLLEAVEPLPTGGRSMPYAGARCACQPAPRPSTTRPPLTWSSAAAMFATTAGGGRCRRGPACRAGAGGVTRPARTAGSSTRASARRSASSRVSARKWSGTYSVCTPPPRREGHLEEVLATAAGVRRR